MLNGITYTPAPKVEAAPIFTALPEPLAAQLVREMVRLAKVSPRQEAPSATFGEKLTARRGRMAYFSTTSVARAPMGRPLSEPTASFAALLYARLSGHSRKRAQEIITANPDRASGGIWSVAAAAYNQGVRSTEDFEQWLQREEQESSSI
jgi:hypothetical protein